MLSFKFKGGIELLLYDITKRDQSKQYVKKGEGVYTDRRYAGGCKWDVEREVKKSEDD